MYYQLLKQYSMEPWIRQALIRPMELSILVENTIILLYNLISDYDSNLLELLLLTY